MAAHEFGHAFGLDHWNNTNCSAVELMNANLDYFFNCGYTDLRAGDIGGVKARYP